MSFAIVLIFLGKFIKGTPSVHVSTELPPPQALLSSNRCGRKFRDAQEIYARMHLLLSIKSACGGGSLLSTAQLRWLPTFYFYSILFCKLCKVFPTEVTFQYRVPNK